MLDRSISPPINRISKVNISKAKKHVLKNGIPVFIINAGRHEIIKTEILLRSGKWFEGQPGVSYFTAKMLMEGTSTRTSQQISEVFESMGAHVDIKPGSDLISISLYVLRRNLKNALLILKECLIASTIPENELNTLKDILIDQIRINEKKNSFLAGREIRKLIFGENHPYGYYLEADDIDRTIYREKLWHYYKAHFLKGIEIIVSGNIDEELVELFNIFSEIPTDNPERGSFSFQTSLADVDQNRKTSIQTSIRCGRGIVSKNDSDHHGLIVLNEILGGYFGSRLMKNIREDKGFTYGVHSAMIHFLNDSIWLIGTDVRKEYRDSALEEIFNEFDKLKSSPVGEEELQTVRNYMLGSFLSGLETSFSLAEIFKKIHLFGLEYEYYEEYIDTINQISADHLQELANKYLNRNSFRIVRIG